MYVRRSFPTRSRAALISGEQHVFQAGSMAWTTRVKAAVWLLEHHAVSTTVSRLFYLLQLTAFLGEVFVSRNILA
jgi:hypothetical protein